MFDKVFSRPATRGSFSQAETRRCARHRFAGTAAPAAGAETNPGLEDDVVGKSRLGEHPRPLHQGRSAFWPAREIFALIERIEATRDEA